MHPSNKHNEAGSTQGLSRNRTWQTLHEQPTWDVCVVGGGEQCVAFARTCCVHRSFCVAGIFGWRHGRHWHENTFERHRQCGLEACGVDAL